MARVAHERIVSDPGIMAGKPTIKGTRVTVELLLEELGQGMPLEEILQAHPHLGADDVRAALRFAADYLANEEIRFGAPEAA